MEEAKSLNGVGEKTAQKVKTLFIIFGALIFIVLGLSILDSRDN